MTKSIQPIETEFKGYRFRSRLEARWAVFLETLGAAWSYEREGFNLGGKRYLPDFYVADWNCWIEMKGQTPSEGERDKCERLARGSGKNVLLLAGDPWVTSARNEYDITLFSPSQPNHDGTSGWEFGEGRRCADEIWLVSEDYGAFAIKPIPHEGDHKYPLSGTYAANIMSALTAARQARFEHGESPKV